MLPAVDSSGNRIAPIKGGRGVCPGCGGEMIAKCGDTKIHHWAHRRGDDCDTWREPMTDWHVAWQECFPEECREVWVGPNREHRADVKGRGKILEVQKSPISAAEIQEREQFYGDMAWMLCGEDFEGRFKMWPVDVGGRILLGFKWKSMRRCWLAAEKDIYIHFRKGIGRVLSIDCDGEGEIEFIGSKQFAETFDHRFDPAPVCSSGKKFVPLLGSFVEDCHKFSNLINKSVLSREDYVFYDSLPDIRELKNACIFISKFSPVFSGKTHVDSLAREVLPPLEHTWFSRLHQDSFYVKNKPTDLFLRNVDSVQLSRWSGEVIGCWSNLKKWLNDWRAFEEKVSLLHEKLGQSVYSIEAELLGEMQQAKKRRMLSSYIKTQPIFIDKFLTFVPHLLAPEFEKYIFCARRTSDFPSNLASHSDAFSQLLPPKDQVKELLALMPRDFRERIKKNVVHMESVAAREEQRRAEEEAERRARDRQAREEALRERLSWPIEKICDHLSYAVNGQASETVSLAQHTALFPDSRWNDSSSDSQGIATNALEGFNPLSVWKS